MSEQRCLDKSQREAVRPVVDFSRCEGKDACAKICPYDVFDVRRIALSDYQKLSFIAKIKNRAHGGKVAYTPHADQCHACGLCVKACPERAIKLVKTHRA